MDIDDDDAFWMTSEDSLEDFETPEYAPYVWTDEKKIDHLEANADEEVVYTLDNGLEYKKHDNWIQGDFWSQTLMHMLLAVAI